MNKKLLAAAIAAAIAAPTAALANDVTIYGVAHLSIDYLDSESEAVDGFDVASRASRLGFKGTEDLSNGLKAIWKMEFQVDMADAGNNSDFQYEKFLSSSAEEKFVEAYLEEFPDATEEEVAQAIYDVNATNSALALYSAFRSTGTPNVSQGSQSGALVSNSSLITARNAYVGLAGGWGTFLVGRHDTPYKMSTGKLDLFADEFGDYNSLIGFQDIRTNSAIAYVSPSWSGLSFAAATVAPHVYYKGESESFDSDGLAEAYSLAITYDNAGFFASAAYEVLTEEWLQAWGGRVTGYDLSDEPGGAGLITEDDAKWRVGLGWTGAGFTIGGLYEQQSDILGVDGFDVDRWQIQAGYTFGNSMIKASYGQESYDDVGADLLSDIDAWAVGFDHNLSKRTKAYVQYADRDADESDAFDVSGFSVGIVHKF